MTGLLGTWEGTLPSLDVQWRIGDWHWVEKQLSPMCPLRSNRTLVRRSPRERGDIQTEEREGLRNYIRFNFVPSQTQTDLLARRSLPSP